MAMLWNDASLWLCWVCGMMLVYALVLMAVLLVSGRVASLCVAGSRLGCCSGVSSASL